jgi:hypothetical protein
MLCRRVEPSIVLLARVLEAIALARDRIRDPLRVGIRRFAAVRDRQLATGACHWTWHRAQSGEVLSVARAGATGR